MTNLTPDIEKKIYEIVFRFTESTIGDECPKYLCYCTCLPLSLFLKINDINCSLTSGHYNNNGIQTPHSWLTLNDYHNVIIDPTIQQFKSNVDPIFIGLLNPAEYTIDAKFSNQSSYNDFKIWAEPLLNRKRTFPKTKDFEERLLLFNLKFATILYNEILLKSIEIDVLKENALHKLYYLTILTFIRLNTKNTNDYFQNLQAKLPLGYGDLIRKANTANC